MRLKCYLFIYTTASQHIKTLNLTLKTNSSVKITENTKQKQNNQLHASISPSIM